MDKRDLVLLNCYSELLALEVKYKKLKTKYKILKKGLIEHNDDTVYLTTAVLKKEMNEYDNMKKDLKHMKLLYNAKCLNKKGIKRMNKYNILVCDSLEED